jgi:hypothetical protein
MPRQLLVCAVSACAVSLAFASDLPPQTTPALISSPIPMENWLGLYATSGRSAIWFSPELTADGAAGARRGPLPPKGEFLARSKFSLPPSPGFGAGGRLVYGGLRAFVAPSIAPSASALAKRLAKAGAELLARATLFGPNGALSAAHAQRSVDDRNLIVQGVNDEAAQDDTEGADAPRSYPLSAEAIAEQQAREARFGLTRPDAAAPTPAPAAARVAALPAGERPRIIDASEGTPIDPLLNKTYDLNYAKKVPPSGDLCLQCK